MALATKGAAASRGRFTLDSATVHTLNADIGERVSVGNVKPGDDDHLVWSVGVTQTGIPVYVVGSAIASGKVFSADDIIGAFADTGKLPALKKALEAHEKREARKATAAAATPPA